MIYLWLWKWIVSYFIQFSPPNSICETREVNVLPWAIIFECYLKWKKVMVASHIICNGGCLKSPLGNLSSIRKECYEFKQCVCTVQQAICVEMQILNWLRGSTQSTWIHQKTMIKLTLKLFEVSTRRYYTLTLCVTLFLMFYSQNYGILNTSKITKI